MSKTLLTQNSGSHFQIIIRCKIVIFDRPEIKI